jgi:hypothetical protein
MESICEQQFSVLSTDSRLDSHNSEGTVLYTTELVIINYTKNMSIQSQQAVLTLISVVNQYYAHISRDMYGV